jgi:hypothetical protein
MKKVLIFLISSLLVFIFINCTKTSPTEVDVVTATPTLSQTGETATYTKTPPVGSTVTPQEDGTPTPNYTATFQAQQTATYHAQQTATAQAQQTSIAQTATAVAVAAMETATAIANATPYITSMSINPVPGLVGEQQIAFFGGNFVSGSTMNFWDPLENEYASKTGTYSGCGCPYLSVVSSTEITYYLNDNNAAGTWYMQVVNPNGKSSLLYNFTVN